MKNEQLKKLISEAVKNADCKFCSVSTCKKRLGHCPNFLPVPELYQMIQKKCLEVVA